MSNFACLSSASVVPPPVQPSVPQLTEEIKVTEFVDRGGFEEVYKGEEE